MQAQSLKQGKCYERCFTYNKPLEWKEIDCESSSGVKSNGVNVFTVKKTGEEKTKFIAYQQLLVDLDYDLEVSGFLDERTINAHHKYLKHKKKAERKAKRRNRKI